MCKFEFYRSERFYRVSINNKNILKLFFTCRVISADAIVFNSMVLYG